MVYKVFDEKIWVDNASEFCNRSTFLQNNDIGNNIMKENLLLLKASLEPSKIKFINTWKILNIDKLDDIVNRYNNTYHRIITL